MAYKLFNSAMVPLAAGAEPATHNLCQFMVNREATV